jgi:PIN domain nuclease of toxin-antitoxin system
MNAVIDACALIAFLRDEPGADAVRNILTGSRTCYVHALNLCEVYYDFWRASTENASESAQTRRFPGRGLTIRRAQGVCQPRRNQAQE